MAENSSDNWPGQAVGTENWPGQPIQPSTPQEKPQRGLLDKLLGTTGPRYQTFPERAVREVLSLPQRTIEAATSAPPGTREATEAMVGPAAETAMTFGPAEGFGLVRGTAKAAAPTQEALRTIKSEQYAQLDKSGIQIPQKDVAEFAQDIRQDLMHGENRGHRPLNQPGTFGLIDELETSPGRFTDIDSVREALGKVRMDVAKNASDARAAGIVIGKIDDFLSSRTGATGELAKAARGNVSALKKSEQITRATESAELSAATTGSGANLANRLRQNIKWIIDPKYPQRRIGFKPEEIELMDEVARGGGRYSVENISRLVSKLGPTHPLSGWGPALASFFAGDAGVGLATLGAGHVAQWLSEKLPMSKINRLDEMIRSRAPAAGQQQAVKLPLTPGQMAVMRGAIGQLIQQLGASNAPQ